MITGCDGMVDNQLLMRSMTRSLDSVWNGMAGEDGMGNRRKGNLKRI